MKNIFIIARNTFRETIRDKILYALLGFGLLFIVLDLFIARISLSDIVIIKSFGLAGIYLFGMIITIFLGSSLIYKEIERRTLYFILSKPVRRSDVILGKFFGLFAAIILTTLLMALVYLAIIFYETGTVDGLGFFAILMQLLEEGLFTAILIFFSSIAAPLTSTISAMILLFVGHLIGKAIEQARLIGGIAHKIALIIYYLLPNLEKFDIRNIVIHNIPYPAGAAFLTIGYAIIYTAILLLLARWFFMRREL